MILMEYIICPICKGKDLETVSTKANLNKDWTNVICKKCALVFVNPRPTKAEYDEFHKRDFLANKNVTEMEHIVPKLKASDKIIKTSVADFLDEYIADGQNILDIGCGYGTLLDILRRRRKVAVRGIELGELDIKAAREYYGLDVYQGSLEDFASDAANAGKYDAVIMNHVFEHLPEPLESLSQIKRILKPKGFLYIGVPNMMNMKNRPEVFFHIAHAFNYSPHSIKLMLEAAGFGIIKFNGSAALPGGMELVAAPGAVSMADPALKAGDDYRGVIAYTERKKKQFGALRRARAALLFFLPEKLRIKIGRVLFLLMKNGRKIFWRTK